MTETTYYELNNKLNIPSPEGKIQLNKDKEAVRAFFIEHVNQNTVFFHTLKEKLEYLVEYDYIEKDVLDKYSFDFIKGLFKSLYDVKFRFDSFMGAYKFYKQYALKTNDGKRYLERYEDRIAFNALTMGDGNEELAMNIADEMIHRRYQPATPTYSNMGKKRGGEPVSCFLVSIEDSMDSIGRAINSALQLSKIGGGVGLNLSNLRAAGDPIKGVEGVGSGVVPVMKLFEDSFKYSNQLGQRQGAGVTYLNIFHPDIMDFLATRKENADEQVRIKTLSLGVVVPDKFYELLANDEYMHLFSPYDVEREYEVPFSYVDITKEYSNMVKNPKIRKKTMKARTLDEEIGKLQQESGYPYILNIDTVDRENQVDGKIIMSNLCVSGDTELLTKDGYIPARELYETENKLEVQIDNRTIDNDQTNRGTSLVEAIPMQLTKKKADIYKLVTKQGFEIKSTLWHKYYVYRDDSIIKIPLSEIERGDKVLVQCSENLSYGKNSDTDLSYIMGIISGDGCLYKEKSSYFARISLHQDKKEFKDLLEEAVSNIIVKYKGDKEYAHNAIFNPTFQIKSQNERDFYELNSAVLGKILKEEFDFFDDTKLSIPKYVKNGTKAVQCAFLSGLFQMDGCVHPNAKYKAMSIELVTIDKQFSKDIQKTLLGLGIYSSIYKRESRIEELPDGKGGLKEYNCKSTYRISIQDRKARDTFMSLIKMKKNDFIKFKEFNKILAPKSRSPKHKYMAEVSSIDFVGKEDVYDTTQPEYHSLIFNGIVTGNCSEILQPQEPSVLNPDLSYKEIGTDISCNLGSINIPNLMESPDFGKSIATMVDALTYVTDNTSIEEVPTVKKGNDLYHTIGLGYMGLATEFAINQMEYGSPESIEFTDLFAKTVRYYSLKESNKIARDRGETFHNFEKSNYADGSYFDKYVEDNIEYSDRVLKLFEGIHVPAVEDWEDLRKDVMAYGLYHRNLSAVAPNGSISYVNETSSSLQPITQLVEKRQEGKTGATFYPAPRLNDTTIKYYQSAYDISMLKVIDVYAAAQKHIDQGMSLTLFMRSTIPAGMYPWKPEGGKMTTKDLSLIRYYAWKKGIKTLYYVRTYTDDDSEVGINECESCSI